SCAGTGRELLVTQYRVGDPVRRGRADHAVVHQRATCAQLVVGGEGLRADGRINREPGDEVTAPGRATQHQTWQAIANAPDRRRSHLVHATLLVSRATARSLRSI